MGVGPVLEKFDGISRIAVLRGGGLGDLIFALPAMAALRAAYPEAALTLLGTPVQQAPVAAVESPVDEFCLLPFAEGVRPGGEDHSELDGFFDRQRARPLDLAVQLHGGGRYSNPFLLRLGARHTVGTRTADAAGLERDRSLSSTTSMNPCVPWRWQGWPARTRWTLKRGLSPRPGCGRSTPRSQRRRRAALGGDPPGSHRPPPSLARCALCAACRHVRRGRLPRRGHRR